MGKYDDIINLEHPTSDKYPRMERSKRAAQFAGYAALSGHKETLEHTADENTHSYDEDILYQFDHTPDSI